MEQIPNYGDERQLLGCSYCGGNANTRDHVPSKVFLDEPFPSNLPVVPSCLCCNQSFSADEEYVACLIDCARSGSVSQAGIEREKIRRILRRQPLLASRLTQARTANGGHISFSVEAGRLKAVVLKLARGHAAYELNEPQLREPAHLAFAPLSSVPGVARDAFETPPRLVVWPEVGSRAMQRLARSVTTDAEWITVQPHRYRYITAVGETVAVRVVLGDYLACEVMWE